MLYLHFFFTPLNTCRDFPGEVPTAETQLVNEIPDQTSPQALIILIRTAASGEYILHATYLKASGELLIQFHWNGQLHVNFSICTPSHSLQYCSEHTHQMKDLVVALLRKFEHLNAQQMESHLLPSVIFHALLL